VKRRFLQFSLRGLLGLAALVCLALGTWHWIETYGNRLDVEGARVGVPVRVKARCLWPFGPTECYIYVGYETADGSPLSDGTSGVSNLDCVERSWLCLYSLESELMPVDQPRQVVVYTKRYEERGQGVGRFWHLKEKIVDVK
jgi:hypothetical protein